MREYQYDVIVIGSGPGGFPAALAAARNGVKTCLIEKNPFLGGLAASGMPWLGMADKHGEQIVKGIPHEIIEKLRADNAASEYVQCSAHGGYVTIDPEPFKLLLGEVCLEAGVDIMLHSLSTEPVIHGNTVNGVIIHGKEGVSVIYGKQIIDATGDGDIAAAAGCEYLLGNSQGEMQPATMLFRIAQVDMSRFFEYLRNNPDECSVHDGYEAKITVDDIVGHRHFCFAGLPRKLKEAEEREGFQATLGRANFSTNPFPGTITVNCTRIHMINGTSTKDLTSAEFKGRRLANDFFRFLSRYVPGFENACMIGSNYQIGVRESRHIKGIDSLAEADAVACRSREDGIAKGAYAIDIHDSKNMKIHLRPIETHFDIPYGCIVPFERDGLIVSGRAISVDPIAFGASRVMGTCMAVGQAAGTAASVCVKQSRQPRDLDGRAIRSLLVEQGAS
jgi:hypothetical protein